MMSWSVGKPSPAILSWSYLLRRRDGQFDVVEGETTILFILGQDEELASLFRSVQSSFLTAMVIVVRVLSEGGQDVDKCLELRTSAPVGKLSREDAQLSAARYGTVVERVDDGTLAATTPSRVIFFDEESESFT
eukprot:GFKZ01014919.1.p1 GENE.GFKZ01014919.1~~GFKZ01014919.1.p1  ORF type:complete len:134 (-),score=16.62 GFKZ01014919.1:604-1005(-)